ncbi:Gmad2 immunoglobulin-like domain-containing protein [Brevibacillus sp. SAFN-007a]|uniref:Gmad2 immunoglobulin-like domain-containing protein n=1 Tax=Brevibacillus sp. SAFN-007a TaxID=3436862 RepID=UPI003F7DE331
MKKFLFVLLTVGLLQGCTSAPPVTQPETPVQPETPAPSQPQTPAEQPPAEQPEPEPKETVYANDIFRNVTVKKTGEDTFEVKGQARVFEAVVNYVVEDGHNELAQGFFQTSAGAPEWGDFTQTVKVKKDEPNSTLMLILFEVSAKDGSRRMELIIPLPEK